MCCYYNLNCDQFLQNLAIVIINYFVFVIATTVVLKKKKKSRKCTHYKDARKKK